VKELGTALQALEKSLGTARTCRAHPSNINSLLVECRGESKVAAVPYVIVYMVPVIIANSLHPDVALAAKVW